MKAFYIGVKIREKKTNNLLKYSISPMTNL